MKAEPEPQFDWADLDQIVARPKRPPNSFTIRDFMERYKKSREAARLIMEKLVAEGVIERMEGAGTIPAYYWYKKGKK